MMTTTAAVRSTAMPHRATPPVAPDSVTAPAGHAAQRPMSVWDERARKMGFPPSAR